MEKFLDKISSYNILNNLLPGAIICYMLKIFMDINILQDGIVENLFIYYFAGMIISRIGSVIVESICKKIKLVVFAPYDEFVRASLIDDKVNILSETNNTYRTMLSMCLMLLIVKAYIFIANHVKWLSDYTVIIILFSLFILFLYSYKKQTGYILKRVKYIIKNVTKEDVK